MGRFSAAAFLKPLAKHGMTQATSEMLFVFLVREEADLT